jgi:hypothetical protein
MKRWRRPILIAATALLIIALGLIGALMWLQSSGRLTQYAQELVRSHSGQNLSFDAVAFASWNVVALTNVRLQQTLPGWKLQMVCPRVEAHYTPQGLLRKQIAAVHVIQPTFHLETSETSVASDDHGTAPSVIVLPVERLHIRHAALHVKRGETLYRFEPIEVAVHQIASQQLGLDARATFDDHTANVHITGNMSLDLAHLTATLDVRLSQIDAPRLAARGLLPADWNLTAGSMDVVVSQVELRGQTLQGTLKIDLQQGRGNIAAVAVQGATMATEMTFAADLAEPTVNLQGPVQLQAAKVLQASSGLVGTHLTAQLPVQLAYASGQWHVHTDLRLQGEHITLAAANGIELRQLSHTASIDAQSTPEGWSLQGELAFDAPSASVATIQIQQLSGTTPVTFDTNAPEQLAWPDLHLQAKAVQWQRDTATPIASPLDLRTTVNVDLQRQQVAAKDLDLDLPNLGRLQGSGTWQWATGTTREVRLTLTPTSLETVWPYVAARLPAPYPTWLVTGQTQLKLNAQHAVWRDGAPTQPLAIDWRFSEMTFSNPEGDYAGEHIQGQLEATVSLTPDWRPASVQASLHLKPFALLMGTFFPELEQHHIASTVTLNSTYHPATGHVDLKVDSQFGPLGRVAIEGKLNTSPRPLQADVTCHFSQIDVQKAWQTFMPQTWRQAADPPDMRGQLNARVQLRGTLAKAHLQGNLQLTSFDMQTGSLGLRNLSLQLPLDVRYPLPEQLPDPNALPASAYGQLHLEHLQFGGLQIPGIATKLALRSDTLIFQRDVQAALLKGVLHLQDLVAYRMLRAQRQIQMQMRLRSLDLESIQHGGEALPMAGRVDADFSRLHFQNGRLQTEGALQLRVAGGRIRIDDIAGWHLGSHIPSVQLSLQTEVPLSLRQLTEIYPIGEIGGTLHVTVDDLVVTAGEPAAFRLHFHVQEQGGEAREISLRALNSLLFTTGSAQVATSFTDRLPYRRLGAEITLQHDILRLRGLYQDRQGTEYFMRAPILGAGVSMINRTPQRGIPFRQFVQRLTATVLKGPDIRIK